MLQADRKAVKLCLTFTLGYTPQVARPDHGRIPPMHLLSHSPRFIQIAPIALCFFAGALPINSQVQQEKKPEKQEEQQTATIRVDTDLVSIDVTVTDGTGARSVTGLKAEDFVIYEDGVRQ